MRVLAPGNEGLDTSNYSHHDDGEIALPLQGDAAPPRLLHEQREPDSAFEKLLEVDVNDEIGRVVDMYFRRPGSLAAYHGEEEGEEGAEEEAAAARPTRMS